jgi:hypothetical protein
MLRLGQRVLGLIRPCSGSAQVRSHGEHYFGNKNLIALGINAAIFGPVHLG